MCYQNCKFENFQGDCTLGSFPPGWICPPDRFECLACGKTIDINNAIDGLCEDCEHDENESQKNKKQSNKNLNPAGNGPVVTK